MNVDPLTADLEKKTQVLLSLVEEEQSPIKSSLSDVPQLKEAYGELRNLARALDQYARTNRGLRYIGLMGTFSSGKSSIINSLIGHDVRPADLPPIDDEITILTHPTNRDALMGAHSRGLLKVTTQPVEAELLRGCFLVDTPGSGDPEVREGMVKDFLPICDLILYTFSATNALSVSDLSILRTVQEQLDFVPIRFVITRSDEFKKDRHSAIAKDNIDQPRIDQFLANLIGRIRSQAPKLDLSPANFFFVDNITKFGIAELGIHEELWQWRLREPVAVARYDLD
jgi:predicted GTPase